MDLDQRAPEHVRHRAVDGRISATKRELLHVSRSIEALAQQFVDHGDDFTIVSLFEHVSYFGYERERYARLAEAGTVIVGFAGTPAEVAAAELPPGVHHLLLDAADPMSDEWDVLVVSEAVSAGLAATDLSAVVAAGSLERGRLFSATVGTDPGWVVGEMERVLERAEPDLVQMALAPGQRVTQRVACRAEQVLREGIEAGWRRTLTYAAQREDDAERMALTDALTGAWNRRFLDRFLSRVGHRAPDLAVVLFDLDGFKQVNDVHGHSVGDAALRLFAQIVRAHVRDSDLLVRCGGDEWLLILPGVAQQEAVARTDAILRAWSEQHLPPPAEHARLAASAGVGIFAADAVDIDAVDAAMYRAKGAGGDRLVALPASRSACA
ncbi:MAG: diguanylate cyclase [Nitriliruptoraceae bacterium]|nr:diguanylate cyclase [Nitriliruptoraceae bacterium]